MPCTVLRFGASISVLLLKICSLNGSAAPIRVKAGDFKLIIYSKPDCPLCDGLKVDTIACIQVYMYVSRRCPSVRSPVSDQLRYIEPNPKFDDSDRRALQDKVSSLLQRAEFQSSLLSGAKLEVMETPHCCDTTNFISEPLVAIERQ
jgi:hypothetical protein